METKIDLALPGNRVVYRGQRNKATQTELNRPRRTQLEVVTPVAPGLTDIDDDSGVDQAYFDASPAAAVGTQQNLTDQNLLKEVHAVVVSVEEHSVVLNCLLPSGAVRIRLPRAILPDHLNRYGTPVYVGLDDSSGIRHPVIRERSIEPQPLTQEEREIEQWLSG